MAPDSNTWCVGVCVCVYTVVGVESQGRSPETLSVRGLVVSIKTCKVCRVAATAFESRNWNCITIFVVAVFWVMELPAADASVCVSDQQLTLTAAK